ncbi:MAG: glycosyltransferase family 9 protein [Verrucomicrobia bacterium]|nr:glycosyltransferase family 9 protein [Verrucomicrobiota bacterium]
MTQTQGKILVIRGGAIGDFILTLPALSALRRQFPLAHLEVLGYPHIAQLALAGGLVNRVRSIEARALAGFFARHSELDAALSEYFSDFDVVVSYLYDPDKIFQTNVASCSAAQFIAGPHRPDEAAGLPASATFLQPLERLAIFDADAVPRLRLNPRPSTFDAQRSTLNHFAVHPGSGSERKNWPLAKWTELLQHLIANTEFKLLLVGGEAEAGRLERLAGLLPLSRVELARSLPLAELAERLGRCAAFIGHDSGISHLAAAVGLPGVILWADTAEAVWRPPSARMVVLRDAKGLAALPVARVVRELANVLADSVDHVPEKLRANIRF